MDRAQKVILTCMCQISNGDEKLAQGMDTVYKIINCEDLSECFYNKVTQEEVIK